MVYKARISQLILTLLSAVIVAFFAYIIRVEGIVTDQTAPLLAGIILVLAILFSIQLYRTKLVVTENDFIVYQGKKRMLYNLNSYSFAARSDNDGGRLIIIYNAVGKSEIINCGFLSVRDFKSLTDDLAITGDKQKPIEIKIKNK